MNSKKEKTRERILKEAYTLFAASGFQSITMKDICMATGLSRGGLYAHFSSTAEIFEAILEKLNQKDALNFREDMDKGESAIAILNRALEILSAEMKNSEDSLSLAMYEYAGKRGRQFMEQLHLAGEKKWRELIEYGISRKEFRDENVDGIVANILYVYQGIRMWSRIVTIQPQEIDAVILQIRSQLIY